MKKATAKTAAVLTAAALCCAIPNAAVLAANPAGGADTGTVMPFNIVITKTDSNLTLGPAGKLTCYGKTTVQYGYTAEVIVELQQDGTTIQTWNASSAPTSTVEKTYYAARGHSYQLKLTHKAYDKNGNLIESIPKYSNVVRY